MRRPGSAPVTANRGDSRENAAEQSPLPRRETLTGPAARRFAVLALPERNRHLPRSASGSDAPAAHSCLSALGTHMSTPVARHRAHPRRTATSGTLLALDLARGLHETVDRRMPEAAALAAWLAQHAAAFGLSDEAVPELGYAHISCRMRIGLGKPLRAYDAVRFGALRQPENTNRNGLVAWIIRGCPAR